MRQQSFRHRGGTSKGIGGWFVIFLAVVIGAFLVYHLILWFRSSSAETQAVAAEDLRVDGASDLNAPTVDVRALATLFVSDGSRVGLVERSGTVEKPTYHLTATLSALAPGFFYEVWLVKDGLADVKSVGRLDARADGSWVKDFTASDPRGYPTLVIMMEPDNGDATPSGNRAAEGKFE